jgi:hypothetical protein
VLCQDATVQVQERPTAVASPRRPHCNCCVSQSVSQSVNCQPLIQHPSSIIHHPSSFLPLLSSASALRRAPALLRSALLSCIFTRSVRPIDKPFLPNRTEPTTLRTASIRLRAGSNPLRRRRRFWSSACQDLEAQRHAFPRLCLARECTIELHRLLVLPDDNSTCGSSPWPAH